MGLLSRVSVLGLAVAISITPLLGQSSTHEEEVVRNTYGALSFLCGLEPISEAARDHKNPSPTGIDREVAEATPVFDISHFQTGTVASISSQRWSTRFSTPDKDLPTVLVGNAMQAGYTTETSTFSWRLMQIRWDVDNSYTPELTAQIEKWTVGQAIKLGSRNWSATGTYTRYATFEITATFQGKTVGPYTASFFFGKDDKGKEVVAPVDTIVSGQLLWEALLPIAYPAGLVRSLNANQSTFLDHWIHDNQVSICSSTRSDLCCSRGVCSLRRSAPITTK